MISSKLNKEVSQNIKPKSPVEDTKNDSTAATSSEFQEQKKVPVKVLTRQPSRRRTQLLLVQPLPKEVISLPKSKVKSKPKGKAKAKNPRKPSGLYEPAPGKDKVCADCGMYFSAQGLGGHRAKAHQGENQTYRAKLKIREKNEQKRITLRLAQYLYYER